MSYIFFENIMKTYQTGEISTHALHHISFHIEQGEFCVILGPSGAGKTTVLNILGGMDRCTSGRVAVDGKEISSYSSRQLTTYRRHDVGFVFQFYNLVQNLTARENVELATELSDHPLDVLSVMESVGLSGRLDHFPAQLSGGEQQRVSIARALAKNPKLLLCDEPTGALDDNTGRQILSLLQETSRASGMTVVLITHNSAIMHMAQRVIRLRNGAISDTFVNEHPLAAADITW